MYEQTIAVHRIVFLWAFAQAIVKTFHEKDKNMNVQQNMAIADFEIYP